MTPKQQTETLKAPLNEEQLADASEDSIESLNLLKGTVSIIEIDQDCEFIITYEDSLIPPGWATKKRIAGEFGVAKHTVERVFGEVREDHPQWFREFKNSLGRTYEYAHPELVAFVAEKVTAGKPAPDGWMTGAAAAEILGVSTETAKKRLNKAADQSPELRRLFKNRGGNIYPHYHPELVTAVASGQKDFEELPEGHRSALSLARELKVGHPRVKKIAQRYYEEKPEWFGEFKSRGKVHPYYHPDLVNLIIQEISSIELAPDDWITCGRLAKIAKADPERIKKMAESHSASIPDSIKTYRTPGRGGRPRDYYHPDLAESILEEVSRIEMAPEGWETRNYLADELRVANPTVEKVIESIRETRPEWFEFYRDRTLKVSEHLHPDCLAYVQEAVLKYEAPPEGWMTNKALASKLGKSEGKISELAHLLADDNESIRTFKRPGIRPASYYSPELAALVEKTLIDEQHEGALLENSELTEKQLGHSLIQFMNEISNGQSLEAQEFQHLMQLFGAENAIDILFQYRPEYKKVDVPLAKRIIGDYLGEFLIIRGDLQLDSLEKGLEYLSDPNLKQALTEVIKNDCLRFYNEQRKEGLVEDDLSTLRGYIADLRQKTAGYRTAELAEVLDEVEEYYKALFEVQIPDNVVDELEPGRLFPDVNQRINILELMGKQKMLIADEMGVGKSASAILAKESLGSKQTLVVVPSNVIEVWQTYLSDYKNGDGSARGYFREGQAPNVLTIDNGPSSLKDLDLASYDYILISQERLNSLHMPILEQLEYDMLIVDEAHKLKNIGYGKRAKNLVKLAERIEGDDKYLALLSGTPVPNHVSDVAMVLKLLYPEKFEGVANKDLTRQILDGDVLDLRSLLVPRMQMKSLAESIEMPTLHEELHAIQMSDAERNAYEVLLEEDELTASQKLQILRQFALNPEMFEMTPGFQSSKLKAVGESLRATFADKNKVAMFVNGYIDGVIRGEHTIFDGLDLPEDVEVHVIDGKVPKAQRLEIRKLLQEQSGRKILLAVSGQTADVGVDYSGAEELYFYNEPWTKYDKRQQQGRVYRPGLRQDLVSHTFYVEGSVEEGIHKYIEYKYTAVEKLLRGIPLSELERELLRDGEKQVDPNLEVNPTLAEHYLSSWHRMLKIYSHVKGIGEDGFVKFLGEYGREYAECYTDLGSRSYQANVGRLAGTTIDKLAKAKKQDPQFVRILDVASGPEMLKRHIGEEYQGQVVSVDINPHHFEQVDENRRVGSFLDLPVADTTIDYANLSLALHYTKLSFREGVYEPVKVFQELNRVLVNEGVAVVNLMHNNDLKNPKLFALAIEKLGFKVVENLSGEVSSANNFRSRMLVLQKVGSCTQDTATLVQQLGGPLLRGFKTAKTDVKLKDSRKIVTSFVLNGAKKIRARMNGLDQTVLNEEQTTLSAMKSLRRKYGSIERIPREMIYQSGLSRAFTGKTYVLFKSLETGNGAVITR